MPLQFITPSDLKKQIKLTSVQVATCNQLPL